MTDAADSARWRLSGAVSLLRVLAWCGSIEHMQIMMR
jgi:hypothetical protein